MELDEARASRRHIEICRLLLAIRTAHQATFTSSEGPAGNKLSVWNCYFEILLELYLAELELRQVYQSWLAPMKPAPSTHRQAARLEELGAVLRVPDASDRRRVIVILAPGIRAAIASFIDAIDTKARLCFEQRGGVSEE
jgi:hypothetical protein